jgi:hypothetical protein
VPRSFFYGDTATESGARNRTPRSIEDPRCEPRTATRPFRSRTAPPGVRIPFDADRTKKDAAARKTDRGMTLESGADTSVEVGSRLELLRFSDDGRPRKTGARREDRQAPGVRFGTERETGSPEFQAAGRLLLTLWPDASLFPSASASPLPVTHAFSGLSSRDTWRCRRCR